jgi:hypothetical protein
MMRAAFLLLLAVASTSAIGASEQGAPCQAVASVTVPQRSYAQLNAPAFDQRVYLYAPDIKSGWGGSFSAFTLWIVEGVYGKPFVQPTGSMEESAFEQIRTSRNVMATPVQVAKDSGRTRTPFTIGKERFVLDLVKVNTSLGGADSVTVNVCR